MTSAKGYDSKEEMAEAAYAELNTLVGELAGAQIIGLISSEMFLSSEKMKDLSGALNKTARNFMQRIAFASFASSMFKYSEIHDKLLKPLGCVDKRAKKLRESIPSNQINALRNMYHHAFDDKTNRVHSVAKVSAAFEAIDKAYPDLFGPDFKKPQNEMLAVRGVILSKFPNAKDGVKKQKDAFAKKG